MSEQEINSYTTISIKPGTKGQLRANKEEGQTYDEYIQYILPDETETEEEVVEEQVEDSE